MTVKVGPHNSLPHWHLGKEALFLLIPNPSKERGGLTEERRKGGYSLPCWEKGMKKIEEYFRAMAKQSF